MKQYDVIVVGRACGCEAALAAARMGCETLGVSIALDSVAHMPCSPSVGGIGKGHLVKEIDALGGEMARVTDLTAIQFRRLNTKKGPAVRGTRTQNDKVMYRTLMKHKLELQPNLELKQVCGIPGVRSQGGGRCGSIGVFWDREPSVCGYGNFSAMV